MIVKSGTHTEFGSRFMIASTGTLMNGTLKSEHKHTNEQLGEKKRFIWYK